MPPHDYSQKKSCGGNFSTPQGKDRLYGCFGKYSSTKSTRGT